MSVHIIYSLRSDLDVATTFLRKRPPSISDRTRGPCPYFLLRLTVAVARRRALLWLAAELSPLPPPPHHHHHHHGFRALLPHLRWPRRAPLLLPAANFQKAWTFEFKTATDSVDARPKAPDPDHYQHDAGSNLPTSSGHGVLGLPAKLPPALGPRGDVVVPAPAQPCPPLPVRGRFRPVVFGRLAVGLGRPGGAGGAALQREGRYWVLKEKYRTSLTSSPSCPWSGRRQAHQGGRRRAARPLPPPQAAVYAPALSRDALKVRSLMNELTAAKTELKQSREVISNSKKALLDNALSQLDAFKNLSNPAINSGNRGGAGNTSSNRGESGRDLRRRASTERKTLGLEERLSRANAAMKTLGQSGEEDPAPRRRPKLSAATAAKADQIKDLVVDLLLLGTIQREVTKRKNFRSNPAAQVGEGTPMAAAQLGGGARRLRGGPARLLRDDASRLLHRRLGLATRGDSLWVLRRTGEEDGGWWPELATRERRWRSEEGDGGVFSNDSKV
ncbi:uncharacterized protein [Triticum aestivum]|uniref:uncharacterized protein isoform X2 n=1 Tax=Triticum aestivum TaxID=4565 RepID=UPI001D004213|nr:uncharacterized protein LOC123136599 isoform X2 [Triticum aestivum]